MAENIQSSEEESELFDVSEKDIFKFTSEFPSGNNKGIPNHYHICVKTEDAYMIFNCCTSQSGKVQDRMKFFGRTYVKVSHIKNTGFTQDTFVDCDNVFTLTNEEFANYCSEGKIQFSGILAGSDYQEVVKGILSSEMVEENTKKLFR